MPKLFDPLDYFLFLLLVMIAAANVFIFMENHKIEIYLDCYGYQENCVPTPDKQVPKQVDLNINWKR